MTQGSDLALPTATMETIEIIGQLPNLNIYTQMAVCFGVDDDSSYPQIIDTLTSGVERLSKSFPWVAGQVVNEGANADSTGVFKIKPFKASPPLVVKDLRDVPSAPNMHALRQSSFPFSMLDESFICPRPTIPIDPALASEPLPVFMIQATFIKGGLILAFLGQHQTMDGTGQGQIINLFSKACRNEPFTDDEIATGSLFRENITPLLEDVIPTSDFASVKRYWQVLPTTSSPNPPKCSWAYFNFTSDTLVALKSLASKSVTTGYITTDDALTAFIWQSVSRARAQRLNPDENIKFERAVDVRGCLGIPQTFPGMIQTMTRNSYTLKELINEPLGRVASQLRSKLDPKELSHDARTLATVLNKTADKNDMSLTGTMDPSKDVMLSSWVRMNLYEQDFGLGLGKPESVRRPQFTPCESLLYLLPKSRDGDVTLAICLRDEDMDRLKMDEGFMEHARYIGE